jgi:hypothetical protein
MKPKAKKMILPRSIKFVIPVLSLLLVPSNITPGYYDLPTHVIYYMNVKPAKGQDRVVDDLCSINALRRHLASNVRYPDAAVKGSQWGTVELYVSFTSDGRVNQIQELTPVRDYIGIQAIEITESVPAGRELIESSRHESLLDESKRVIMSLPRCDIQEVFGKTLKFTFNFILKQT